MVVPAVFTLHGIYLAWYHPQYLPCMVVPAAQRGCPAHKGPPARYESCRPVPSSVACCIHTELSALPILLLSWGDQMNLSYHSLSPFLSANPFLPSPFLPPSPIRLHPIPIFFHPHPYPLPPHRMFCGCDATPQSKGQQRRRRPGGCLGKEPSAESQKARKRRRVAVSRAGRRECGQVRT